MAKKRILFVTYGGGHITMILPVMRALRDMAPDVEPVLMALTTGYNQARIAGEKPLGFADFAHLADAESALKHGRRLLGENAGANVSEAESLAYLGISYSELEEDLGPKGAADAYAKKGRAAFAPVRFMERVIQECRADVVVATNSPRAEGASLKAANRLGVPCISLIDLLPYQAKILTKNDFWPDRICVLAEPTAAYLRDHGAPEERVLITGNPAFDGLAADSLRVDADRFLGQKGWRGKAPVLFGGHLDVSAEGDAQLDVVRKTSSILEAYVKEREDRALILRYHPSCWLEMPRPDEHPNIHFSITPEEPIHPLIVASSVIVVQNSTVGLEASIAGKPVISLEYLEAGPLRMSWAANGVSRACRDWEDLTAMIDQDIDAPASSSRPFKTDGNASIRIGETILSLI